MSKNGIDISKWQGVIDWAKTSKAVDFAIIKLGGADCGLYTDKMFNANYTECKKYGVPCGCYFFIGKDCTTVEKGIEMAGYVLEKIKGLKFEYPIYLDVESTPISKKAGVTACVKAFCNAVETAGYYVGIYGSDISTFKDRVNVSELTAYDKWVARYPLSSRCKVIVQACGMRQYSSTGKVTGIKGNVDLDIAYYDFPTIMKNKHLNGF